ncbi:MAG: protein translocase subunit SecF, partial [Desulfobulbaceae bacterium]|nr:protein translocase subunit SecF [Desulfobulbaceae bacterium]
TFLKKPNIDYMKLKKISFAISGLLILCGLFAFTQIMRGQGNLGVDFTGGSLLQYKANKSFELNTVRKVFTTNKIDGVELQPVTSENRLIVKIKKSEKVVGADSVLITDLLTENLPDYDIILESQSEIGSSISEMLRNKALQAIAISLFGVICYLALRFDIRFGVAAAIATFHDVVVVLGICWVMNIEITLLIVTALLTLAGYSLNDSVVVFDRIRENMRKQNLDLKFSGIINLSINEVLSRTIVTSLTSALVLGAIFILGGTVIHDFSFALLAGLIVGTYSSIFVASPVLQLWPAEKS